MLVEFVYSFHLFLYKFSYTEQSTSCLKQRKFSEACTALQSQHDLGSKINFAPVLVKYYVSLMCTDRCDEANKIRDELIATLNGKFRDTPDNICSYADSLQNNGELFEALLFYQVALHYAEKKTNPRRILELPQKLVNGVRSCSLKLFKKSLISKKLLQDYVIPILLRVRDQARRTIKANVILSVLVQSVVLFNVQDFHFLYGDLLAQGAVLKEGITLFRSHLEKDKSNFRLYGFFLERYGDVCLLLNRPEDAKKMMKQAVTALKKAKDFDHPHEKTEELRKIGVKLKHIEEST